MRAENRLLTFPHPRETSQAPERQMVRVDHAPGRADASRIGHSFSLRGF
jgi:hypothetical protein